MNSGIFISYRRSGGLETARNLRDRLVALNYKVFFDLTSMREGKFNQQIFEQIRQADDFILILSEGSLDRCIEEQDWLRMEIRCALMLHKNIIPIWKPAFKGFPSSLPPDIVDIKSYDSVKLSEDYYDAFFQKVIARLKAPRVRNEENKASYTTIVGQDSRFISFKEWIAKKAIFKAVLFIRISITLFFLSSGITLLILNFIESNVSQLIVGVICLILFVLFFYLVFFMKRIKRKYSSYISEIEKNNKPIKRIRSLTGEVGLVCIGLSRVDVLVPCKYLNISRIDRNNYILELAQGKSLYNKNKKRIVGQGPYETIEKSKYKIECVGKNGIQRFSLDGYERYE